MASHFSAIGLPAGTPAEIGALVQRARTEGVSVETAHGRYIRWAPGDGPEMWLWDDAAGEFVGGAPHYTGDGQILVSVTRFLPRDDAHLSGGIYGWAAPSDPKNPDSGAYPLVVDVPDFAVAAERLAHSREPVTLQIAGFAHDLTCYPDEDAYNAAQTNEGRPGLAVESFIPTGLFQASREGPPPPAQALITGHIVGARQGRNPATGAPYWALLVRTYGGIVDIVADPATVEGLPAAGGVARGTFWLTGRLVDEAPRP